jgi:hypothetical protein
MPGDGLIDRDHSPEASKPGVSGAPGGGRMVPFDLQEVGTD